MAPFSALFAAVLAGAAAFQSQDSLPVLSLQEALRLARLNNPEYRAAVARSDAAHDPRLAAWGAFLPHVDATASFSRFDVRNITFLEPEGSAARLPEPLETTTFSTGQGLSLSWQVFDGGRRIFEVARSRAAARAGDYSAETLWRRIQADVADQYFEALKQETFARLARDLVEARKRDLEAAEARYRIAAVSEADVLGARIEAQRQEMALFEAEAAAAKAREALRALCGLPPDQEFRLEDRFEVFDPAGLDVEALVVGASRHPQVLQREAELDAASRALWLRRSTYLPSVWLNVGFSRSETQGGEGDFFLFDPRNRSTSLGLVLRWSLFDGFQKEAQNAQASAERTAARYALAKAARDQEVEVRNAYRDLQLAYRRHLLAEQTLELARNRMRIARERYRLGSPEMPFWALQEVLRQATEAERDAVTARYDFLKAIAHLEQAVGEPLSTRAALPGP